MDGGGGRGGVGNTLTTHAEENELFEPSPSSYQTPLDAKEDDDPDGAGYARMFNAPMPPTTNNANSGSNGAATLLRSEEEMEEVRQLEHNRRFQQAVLQTMDKQLASMEEELFEKHNEFVASERAREDMGTAFAAVKRELASVTKVVAKASAAERAAVDAKQLLAAENRRLRTDNERLLNKRRQGEIQIQEAQDKANRALNELAQVKRVHSMFGDEIKVHQSLQEGLKKEVENAQREVKLAKDKEQSHVLLVQQQSNELLELKQRLQTQEGETKKAQTALEATVNELELLSQQKKVLTLQWEDALRALQQRDKTTAELHEKKTNAESNLIAAKNVEQQLLQRNSQVTKKLERLEVVEEQKHSDFLQATHELHKVRELNDQLTKQSEMLMTELERSSVECDALKRKQAQNDALILELKNAERVSKLERRARQQETNRGIEIAELEARTVLQQAEAVREKAEQTKQQNNDRLVSLENQYRSERLVSLSLERELVALKATNAMLDSELKGLITKHDASQHKVHTLEDSVERLAYRSNKAEAEALSLRRKMMSDAEAYAGGIVGEIGKLERQLNSKKDEYDQINAAFIKTQRDVVQAQHTMSSFGNLTKSLQAQLRVSNDQRMTLRKKTEQLTKETNDKTKEVSLVQLELKRVQTQLSELKQENVLLLKRVEDAHILMVARQQEQEKEVATLKARLAATKIHDKGNTQITTQVTREKNVLERKLAAMTEKYENQQRETKQLADRVIELTAQLKTKKKHVANSVKQLNKWSGQFDALLEREFKDRNDARRAQQVRVLQSSRGQSGGPTLPHLSKMAPLELPSFVELAEQTSQRSYKQDSQFRGQKSSARKHFSSSSSSSSARGVQPPASHRIQGGGRGRGSQTQRNARNAKFMSALVDNMKVELNKASSLAAERLNEVVRLQEKLREIQVASGSVVEERREFRQQLTEALTQKRELEGELLHHKTLFLRAEGVAATLERQLHTCISLVRRYAPKQLDQTTPLLSMDLSFNADIAPSAALREAIREGTDLMK